MDYQWYFPQNNGGGGGGTDYKTVTLPVTTDSLRATTSISDIDKETFAYSVEAFEVVNGVESPVFISPNVIFNNNTATFSISWQTAFNGYININYWEKK